MANFDTPLGRDAERRLPTTDERQNGFPCGAASQALFNGLFHRIESELGEVINHAGLVGDDGDFTQLRQAIIAIIASETGSSSNTDQYLLVSQAQARLPIFPEFLTSDGKINISSPATGTIRLPGNIQFMHRGIFPVTTTQTDFSTDINKIYHLRWNPTNGFELKDLSNSSYNPNSLNEENEYFDTSYDDMLISRIITNSSNISTITNLSNKNYERKFETFSGQGIIFTSGSGNDGVRFSASMINNFSRTPVSFFQGMTGQTTGNTINGYANGISNQNVTRYSSSADVTSDFTSSVAAGPHGQMSIISIL